LIRIADAASGGGGGSAPFAYVPNETEMNCFLIASISCGVSCPNSAPPGIFSRVLPFLLLHSEFLPISLVRHSVSFALFWKAPIFWRLSLVVALRTTPLLISEVQLCPPLNPDRLVTTPEKKINGNVL
jgi:hypothetical protein